MKKIFLFFLITVVILCLFLNTAVFAEESLFRKKSLIYQPKYLPADFLKEKLSFPKLRIIVIEEKGYLLLEGEKNKIKEAEKILKKIDSRETPYQIKYTLTVIDLSTETDSKIEIPAAGFSSEKGNDVGFLSEDQVLELYSPEVMDYLEIETAAKKNLSQRIAQPTVVTTFGESGSISFSEEYFGLEEELHNPDAISLSVNFNPLQLNKKQGIKSRVELEVNDVRELNTTTWIEPGKKTLLGLMNLKQQQEKDSIFGEQENIKKRNFAVYMTAKMKNNHDSESSKQETFSASLDGAEQLLLNFNDKKISRRKNYFQVLGGEKNPQFDFYLESAGNKISTELKTRKEEFINLGVNFQLKDSLKLGAQFLHQQNKDLRMGLALSDYVSFGKKIWLAASYIPIIYNFKTENIETNNGWIEAGYKANKVFFKIRYSSDYSPQNLRLETGFKIFDNFYLTAAGVGDTSGIEYYLGGIRLDF